MSDKNTPLLPATEKQRERLKWWAEKLGRKLPSPLTKTQAHELIEEWLEERPELENEWYEHKEQVEEFEMETSIIAGDVDDWREYYNCKKVSEKKTRDVLKIIGSRAVSEPIDQFMNKFFAELHRQEPALFTGRQKMSRSHKSKSKGCLVLFIAWFLLVGIIGALAAHLFSK